VVPPTGPSPPPRGAFGSARRLALALQSPGRSANAPPSQSLTDAMLLSNPFSLKGLRLSFSISARFRPRRNGHNAGTRRRGDRIGGCLLQCMSLLLAQSGHQRGHLNEYILCCDEHDNWLDFGKTGVLCSAVPSCGVCGDLDSDARIQRRWLDV
jgi:hypothetical protein